MDQSSIIIINVNSHLYKRGIRSRHFTCILLILKITQLMQVLLSYSTDTEIKAQKRLFSKIMQLVSGRIWAGIKTRRQALKFIVLLPVSPGKWSIQSGLYIVFIEYIENMKKLSHSFPLIVKPFFQNNKEAPFCLW